MKCIICKKGELNKVDEEYICEKCGGCFYLEYCGVYLDGSNDRLDRGHEPLEWRKEHSSFFIGNQEYD